MKAIFPNVPIEVSARHIHLGADDCRVLFGHDLTAGRPISQPDQFVAQERVAIEGPSGRFPNVAVVGPTRIHTQVELTKTDCRTLGIEAPVAVSGDNVPFHGQLTLKGPAGEIRVNANVIVAQRHLHLDQKQAEAWGLRHLDRVIVEIKGARHLIFHEVIVRSRPGVDALSFMIDTDEANAADVKTGDTANLIIHR